MLKLADAGNVKVIDLGRLASTPVLRQIQASLRFAGADFDDYDFYFFSGNWSRCAGKSHRPNIFYCHTPVRAFYDFKTRYLSELPPPQRLLARAWIAVHSRWDRETIGHMDQIVANSENVKGRIKRYYGRESTVVNPPVATAKFRFDEVGDYWLSVNRIRPEKRIDLQIEIFRRLPAEKLLIVGDIAREVTARAVVSQLKIPPNVQLTGAVHQKRLADLYAKCKGFITTAVDEDFGMTPVEAMASGKAVLATDEGGYRETVIDGSTGWLLPIDADAFASKIKSLDEGRLKAMKDKCIARAREFDEGRFIERMRELMMSSIDKEKSR